MLRHPQETPSRSYFISSCYINHSWRAFLIGVLRTAYRDFFSQYGVCVMFGGRQTAAVCLLNNVPTVWVPHLSLAHTHTKADVSFFLDEVLGGEQRVVARRGSAEDASDSKVHLTLSAVGGRPTPLLSLAVSYFDMAFL